MTKVVDLSAGGIAAKTQEPEPINVQQGGLTGRVQKSTITQTVQSLNGNGASGLW